MLEHVPHAYSENIYADEKHGISINRSIFIYQK